MISVVLVAAAGETIRLLLALSNQVDALEQKLTDLINRRSCDVQNELANTLTTANHIQRLTLVGEGSRPSKQQLEGSQRTAARVFDAVCVCACMPALHMCACLCAAYKLSVAHTLLYACAHVPQITTKTPRPPTCRNALTGHQAPALRPPGTQPPTSMLHPSAIPTIQGVSLSHLQDCCQPTRAIWWLMLYPLMVSWLMLCLPCSWTTLPTKRRLYRAVASAASVLEAGFVWVACCV